MLYNFLIPLADDFAVLNLVRYLTFRTGAALLTAMLISLVIGPGLIRWLKVKQKKGQPIRTDGPQSHILSKAGTPTMGGLMILIGLVASTILWADLSNPYVWACLAVTASFGAIGFLDDFLKVTKANPKGVPGRWKFLAESCVAVAIALWVAHIGSPSLMLPFVKDTMVNLAWFYPIFGVLVIVGAGNAVNLTDGLDGLAIMPVIIAASAFGLISYLVGNASMPIICRSAISVDRANWRCFVARSSVRALVFCGSTRRLPWCSWATRAVCRWAGLWGLWRWSQSMNWCC